MRKAVMIHKNSLNFKYVIMLLVSVLGSLMLFSIGANADDNNRTSKEVEQIADKYVEYSEVEKKFFILPTISNELTSDEIKEVEDKVNVANLSLKQTLQQTNPREGRILVETSNRTYVANPTAFRGFGVNKITFHWNYARVYLDRNQARALFQAGLAGGSTALGGFLGGIGGAAAGAAIGAYLASVLGSTPNSGIWVDYNYYNRTVTAFGWQ